MGAGLLAASALTAYADEMDQDGYPVMYLRGGFNNWGYSDATRFTRDGDKYSLEVNDLSGEFKISGTDWNLNYGAENPDNAYVSAGTAATAYFNGSNWKTDGMSCTISFEIVRNGDTLGNTTVYFGEGGDNPPVSGLSGTLPVLYINVYTDATHTSLNPEIIDKDLNHKEYFSDAEYWLDVNGCQWLIDEGAENIGSADEPLPLEIKGRGNWTLRGFSKKPFKLKLGAKQKMLGMTKSKHYAILAHADDGWGYLRNFCGFNLGKRIGLPWTPAQQPVEVVINGNYRGLYFLTESIRIEKDRINIEELDDNVSDPVLASGGYLVELDNYDEDNQIVLEERSCVEGHYLDRLRITPDTPEEYSELQRRFVTDQFDAMNNAVGENSDVLWSYLDLDDAVRYYIVEELISHTESYHGSTYLFRDRGSNQKWHFSPLWDCGNAFSGPDNNFFYNEDPYGNTWIPSIRTNDTFNAKLTETWLWFMNTQYEGIFADINAYTEAIKAAARADRRRWQDAPTPDGGQSVADNSDMDSKRDAVVNKLRNKANWLKQQFGDYVAANVTVEPARDTTPAAPLPDYLSTGVENIGFGSDNYAPVEYFNLQGIRVENPGSGIYIRRQGSSVSKVVL